MKTGPAPASVPAPALLKASVSPPRRRPRLDGGGAWLVHLPVPVATPRSILLRRVLGCLRDYPHDNTPEGIAQRLGLLGRDEIDAALRALECDGLVLRAGDRSQLTRRGWESARELDPRPDLEW